MLVTITDKKERGDMDVRATKAKGANATKILVDTNGLQEMLCAGRPAAVKIGTDAGARVQSGRRDKRQCVWQYVGIPCV